MTKLGKERLDQLLVDQELCESRELAQRMIRAGQVTVNGTALSKPGNRVAVDARIVLKSLPRFVSRGGEKLAAALEAFPVVVNDRVALDIGASTGGFTDCLLQAGAARVIAVDVGKGQLHWKLRQDPRVTVLESVNARYLTPAELDTVPGLAVADVSFISLTKVLPAVTHVLAAGADLITLIKPQFEAGRSQVGKGGVVKDPAVHDEVIERVKAFGIQELSLAWRGLIDSPLLGPAGNREFLAWWNTP